MKNTRLHMRTNVYLCFSVARLQSRSSWGNGAIWHIVLSASTFVYHRTIRGESLGVALASSLIHLNSREPGGPAEQKPTDANTFSHSSHIHRFFLFQWAVVRWRPVVFKIPLITWGKAFGINFVSLSAHCLFLFLFLEYYNMKKKIFKKVIQKCSTSLSTRTTAINFPLLFLGSN